MDEMDTQYNNQKQKRILANFWNFINLNDGGDSFLGESFSKPSLGPQFDLKKCRVEKLPTVCLKILSTFLSYNSAEINE